MPKELEMIPGLSVQENWARWKRLESATGVPYPTGYFFFRGFFDGIGRLFMKPKLYHEERLPQPRGVSGKPVRYRPWRYRRNGTGRISQYPFILAANHGRTFDIPLAGQMRRGMVWACKPSWCKYAPLAWVFQRMGAVPVFRTGFDDDPKRYSPAQTHHLRSISYTREEFHEVVLDALARGMLAMMFPEATRAARAKVSNSKTGIGWLAVRSGKLVVPLAIVGCAKEDPNVRVGRRLRRLHKKLMRRKVIGIFGTPINPTDFAHLGEEDLMAKAITTTWEESIGALREEGLDLLKAHS